MLRIAPPLVSSLQGLSPAEVAAQLKHLPGFLWLDSSSAGEGGNDPTEGPQFSLLAARPSQRLEGNLFCETDFEQLRQHYLKFRCSEALTPDLGFPGAGLYGVVDYEGDFVFGDYREYLLYDHRREIWSGEGELAAARRKDVGPTSLPRLQFEAGMTRQAYAEAVGRALDYIAAGDIYQVNLAHQFTAPRPENWDPFALYLRLREISPAPHAAYVDLGTRVAMSSSPEEFLCLSGRTIRTRPIKGTRPRFRDRGEDEKSAYDLLTSQKEIAELVMITDLERNDLGQVCEYGSVAAVELLKLERYAQVFHLVSTVEGVLRREVDPIRALRACFPGGSITGAPKKRAREIIAELERGPRGLYTGTIGGFGYNGECRFNIAIRTLVAERDLIHFHAGAGIVADSDPEREWEETLHKAAGILLACGQ